MTTQPADEAATDLAAVLMRHHPVMNQAHCHCGWKATVDERRFQPGWVGVEGQWLAHMAEALAPYVRQQRAAAWDEALQAVAWAIDNGPTAPGVVYTARNNPYRADERRGEPA